MTETEIIKPIFRFLAAILCMCYWAATFFFLFMAINSSGDLLLEWVWLPMSIFGIEFTHVAVKGRPLFWKGKLLNR